MFLYLFFMKLTFYFAIFISPKISFWMIAIKISLGVFLHAKNNNFFTSKSHFFKYKYIANTE